jgi:hypothetical protein
MDNKRSQCGPGILDHCIVKITDTRKVTLYQHPKYMPPDLEATIIDEDGFHGAVHRDGQLVARFKKYTQAINWMAFMRGYRNAK